MFIIHYPIIIWHSIPLKGLPCPPVECQYNSSAIKWSFLFPDTWYEAPGFILRWKRENVSLYNCRTFSEYRSEAQTSSGKYIQTNLLPNIKMSLITGVLEHWALSFSVLKPAVKIWVEASSLSYSSRLFVFVINYLELSEIKFTNFCNYGKSPHFTIDTIDRYIVLNISRKLLLLIYIWYVDLFW